MAKIPTPAPEADIVETQFADRGEDPPEMTAEGDTLPGASIAAGDSDLATDAPADVAQAADLSDLDQHAALDGVDPPLEPALDPNGNPAASDGPTDTTDDAGADAAVEALAQAKADAHAAAAQAKADANAAAAKLPKPRARKATAAPAPNLRVLNHLTKQCEMLNHYGLRQGLLDEMRDLYGAEIVEDELNGVTITIEGVGIDPADSLENALKNWANAARRAILEATA